MKPFTIIAAALSPVCLFTSCKEKGEVNHYRVDKAPAVPSAQPAPATAKSTYSWTLPEGWSDKPASGMRLATILIPASGTQLNASITEFGGDLAGNVNRWRGQIGLPQLKESKILSTLEKVDTGLGQGYLVTLINPDSPDKAMLAAIIPRPSGTSVFVKVMGSSENLQTITAPFRQFTQSLK